jgi:ribulose-phosphate 3-epimerase
MDGKFVNNTTIGPDDLRELPNDREIEYHLMVANPAEYIRQLPGGKNKIFQVHLESVLDEEIPYIRQMVEKKKARLAWVLNPPTPTARAESHLGGVVGVLLMTVNPGWAGQKYIQEVEGKMRALRASYPSLTIEIDGGVDATTIPRARKAGANRFAAASAVFGQKEPDEAYRGLLRIVNE